MPRRYNYSRWDGTQVGFEMDADDILAELTNDILYNGDVNSALRRMMQQGFRDQNDQRVQGMRELLEKLRRRRRDQLEQYDLGGAYDDIAQELRDVVELERGVAPGRVTYLRLFTLASYHLDVHHHVCQRQTQLERRHRRTKGKRASSLSRLNLHI